MKERADEASAHAGSGSSAVEESLAEGRPVFSIERASHELKVAAEEHNRQIERPRIEHELDEVREENRRRRGRERVLFCVILGLLIAALAISFAVAVWSSNSDTRRFRQAVFISIFAVVTGAVGGYLTGRSGRKPQRLERAAARANAVAPGWRGILPSCRTGAPTLKGARHLCTLPPAG